MSLQFVRKPNAAPWGRVFFALSIAALTAGGCSETVTEYSGSALVGAVTDVAPPPGLHGARYPRLTQIGDGVLMSWLEPLTADGDRFALRLAIYRDNAWQPTATVAQGTDWFVNWADFPGIAVAADGRNLLAFWLRRNPVSDATYAYDVVFSNSSDAGISWSAAKRLHSDGTATEHGFVSVVASGGGFRAVWLDGRAMASDGPMSLRSAYVGIDGNVSERAVLDARTCECCKTAALSVGGKTLAAWRDRSEDEIRDIYFASGEGARWSTPVLAHADGWQIEGCPVNGPALAGAGDASVALAWFTLAGAAPKVKVAFSNDGGAHFSTPTVLAEGARVLGRVAAAVPLQSGPVAVSWLGPGEGKQSNVYLALAEVNGQSSPSLLGELPGGRQVGFPQLARFPGGLLAAWTNPALAGGLEVRHVEIIQRD